MPTNRSEAGRVGVEPHRECCRFVELTTSRPLRSYAPGKARLQFLEPSLDPLAFRICMRQVFFGDGDLYRMAEARFARLGLVPRASDSVKRLYVHASSSFGEQMIEQLGCRSGRAAQCRRGPGVVFPERIKTNSSA